MKITFLGTGTSQGVPIIGCPCEVCQSTDVRDKRLRSSVMISIQDLNIIIDVGPDFRQQMLTNDVKSLHAILLTHEHNDHVIGLDDIRPFNFKQHMDMPLYAIPRVIDDITNKFAYIFQPNPYPGIPRIVCHPIDYNQKFAICNNIHVQSIRVMHGTLPIVGYRIGTFAYITDASLIGDQEMEELGGLDVLVLNALQYRPHYSHFTFDEAVAIAKKLNAKNTFFTHISHELGFHSDILAKLPQNIQPAFDTMTIEI